MSFQSSKTDSEVCVVCCKSIDIYAFGVCDHPVCYECSTRMRVLCRQNECPICRQDLPEVIFSRKLQKFEDVRQKNSFIDQKYQIYFQNNDVFRAYEKLLEHPCTMCRNRVFSNFILLKDHVRKEHEQFYCDLCVENLKIFSSERKSYNRSELARHRRIGDPDNTSHRGHPLCEFCDQRHLDKDELFRHLRREHFFCHFCDADGLYEFYSDYDYLRQHFRHKHFLCEEGSCKDEKFTSAFRTDIDLKVHKATVHNKNLSKAQAKQARTLELEFTITPRMQQSNYGRSSGLKMDVNSRKSNHSLNQNRGLRQVEMEEGAVGGVPENISMFGKSTVPYVDNSKDFPTLDGKHTPQNQKMKSASDSFAQRLAKSSRFNVKVSDDNLGTDEFPSLSGNSVETVVQSQWKVNGSNKIAASSSAVLSTAGPSKQSKSVFMQLKNSDFPSLPTNNKTKSSKVSIQVNNPSLNSVLEEPRKNQTSLITDNSLVNTLGSSNSSETMKTSQKIKLTEQDFPQLSEGSKPPEPSWVTVKTSSKVKTKSAINETSVGNKTNNLNCDRKSSSVTIPVHNNKINLQGVAESLLPSVPSNKNKSKKKKTKNTTTNEITDVSNSNKIINFANEPNKKKKKEPIATTYSNHVTINEINENQENENPQLEDSNTVKSADLQIDTFCKDVNISELTDDISQQTSFLAVEDFPELPSKPNNIVQPLNSSQQSNNKPPPGFNLSVKSLNKPPPGFRVSVNSVSQASNLDGVSSFSNNKGETHFSSREIHKYHEPENFNQRNTELINKIKDIVEHDESHFSAFKVLSGQFRQGTISSSNYYQQCLNLIGRKEFAEIFPELLVLLPDIAKQRELLNVHNMLLKERELCGNIDLAKENGTQFLVCATCQQVLARVDFRKHMDVHEVNGNFPLLSSSVANNVSWVKK